MKAYVLWFAGAASLVVAQFVCARLMPIDTPGAASAMTMPAESFMADNLRAMDKMMAAMSAQGTGDADRDFVATMVPHHQGAVDMALAELRYGKDETLRRMAQEIIVEQKQEIEAMKLAVDRLPDPKVTTLASADVCRSRSPSRSMRDTLAPKGP